MQLKFQVQTKIQKPLAEVFDAVYNPTKLNAYFTTGGASAALDEGTTVIWRFADYPGDCPVTVKKVTPNQQIIFEWPAYEPPTENKLPLPDDYKTTVEMTFESLSPALTPSFAYPNPAGAKPSRVSTAHTATATDGPR